MHSRLAAHSEPVPSMQPPDEPAAPARPTCPPSSALPIAPAPPPPSPPLAPAPPPPSPPLAPAPPSSGPSPPGDAEALPPAPPRPPKSRCFPPQLMQAATSNIISIRRPGMELCTIADRNDLLHADFTHQHAARLRRPRHLQVRDS